MKVHFLNRIMRASIPPIFGVILLGFIPNLGLADPVDTVTVTIPDTSATPGDTIDVPIRVSDVTNKGIYSFQLTLTYYDSILTVDSAYTTGTIAEGWGPPTYGITPGQINIAAAKWVSLAGSGPLVYIRFIVNPLASPGDTTPLHFEHVRFNEGDPAARPNDGTFTVIGPEIDVTPTSFNVTLCIDSTKDSTLTISNIGNATLNWDLSENPAVGWLDENPTSGSINPAGHTDVSVQFDASGLSPGTYNDTLVITSNDQDEPTVNVPVQLTVVPPDIRVSPTSFNDTLCTGGDTTHTLMIYNDGDCALTWNIAENPAVGWLSEAPTNGSVSAGDSQDVTLTYDASGLAPGTYNDTLVITSNDPDENPVNVPVTLVVERPDIDVSPANFNVNLLVGATTKDTTLVISNTGECVLTWTLSEAAPVGWLDENLTSGSINPGEHTDVNLHFDASGLAPGTYNDTLVITSNDPDEPTVNIPVQLTVQEPGINVSADSIDYGCVVVGNSKDSVLTVSNTGDATLTVDSIVSSNPTIFTVIYGPGFPETIGPGGSIDVTIRFSPAAAVAYKDSIMISSDDPDNPILWVLVTGTGSNAPTITSTPITTAVEDSQYIYDVDATTPNSDTLTFSLLVNPHWLSINESTGVVSGTPTNADVGDTTVTIQVEDGCSTADTQSYTLIIVNVPPHITSVPDTLAWEDVLYTYNVESDDEGQGNTYYAFVVQPHWLAIDNVTGVISGTPGNDDVGDTTVTVQVNDGNGGVDTQSYTLHVINTNDPPYQPSNPSPADDATNQPINVDLYWSGGDPDIGDTVTYNVYFGTSYPAPFVGSAGDTMYDPGTLNYYTHYWWQIIAVDNHGASNPGPWWDFYTGGGAIGSIILTADDSTVIVSNYTRIEPIYLEVRDEGGQPSPDQEVVLTVSAGGGILSQDTVITDALGKAALCYRSSPTAGIYIVTATCNSVTGTVPIRQIPYVIAKVSLTPEVYRVHAGRQILPITGELQDQFGNHIDATSPNDITFTKFTGRGSLGASAYLDTLDSGVFVRIVYITYTGGVDTAKIEGTRNSFADTSVIISLATTGYVIWGHVRTAAGAGVTSVEMRLSGDASDTVFTDSDGYYQFVNLLTGIYTVTPNKSGWVFNPSHRDYVPLNLDQGDQDYIGTAPCIQWTARLTVSGCGITQERFFGVHCFATNGFDEGLDVACPPPAFLFHSYFYIAEDPCYLSTDIKAPDAVPLCWTLKIVNADGCMDTLRWDPAELPETALLLDGIDMHSESLAIFEGNQTLYICSRLDTFDIPMTGVCGWNLVSVPVIPPNKDVNAVFPGNCGVFTFDPVSGNYVMPDEVEPGVGYWVCYATPCTITVIGIPLTNYTRSLGTGWSMIGSIAKDADFSNPNDDPDGSIIEGSLYGLNPTNCSYYAANTIVPANAYWVCAIQPCDLTVSDPPKSKSLHMGSTQLIPQITQTVGDGVQGSSLLWSLDLNIKSSDASYGSPIMLRLGGTDEFNPNLNRVLPPALPGTEFDAWLCEQHLHGEDRSSILNRLAVDIRESNNSTWTVFVKAPHGFSVSWNPLNMPDNQKLTLITIDGQEIDMKKQAAYSFKDTQGKLMSIKIRGNKVSVPEVFGLFQNTPNPFIDVTSVAFQLPKKIHVTLTIYNIVGEKVCELLNKDMDAGYHTVCWDGRDDLGNKVNEGIYFFHINADRYVKTRKMILLR